MSHNHDQIALISEILNLNSSESESVEPMGQKSNFFDWDLGGVVKMIRRFLNWP